jgi:transcriptional regulator NrdR family protein
MTTTRAPQGARAEARSTDLGSRNHLTCPACGGSLRLTTDSRLSTLADGETKIVRRRRRCEDCGERHSTIEVTEATLFAPVLDLLDQQIKDLTALRDNIKRAS